MGKLRKNFEAIDVGDGSDGRWAAHIQELWPRAENALTEEGKTAEGAASARHLFKTHMPELVPTLDQLIAQVDRPRGETFLTLAAIRPFFAGCSQVGGDGTLLRNYDSDLDDVDGIIVRSRLLRPVIGTQDAGWGLLDGMNDAGLAVSLTFGGRYVHGPGFGLPIVLRYLLETCDTVDQALAKLASMPVPIPQNVTLVDADTAVTVYTLKPPLYQLHYAEGLGTVYTARYRPGEGTVTYYWPDESWELSLHRFVPETRTITLGLS